MKFRILLIALGLTVATLTYAGNSVGKVGQVLVGRLGDQVYVELLASQFVGWPCTSMHPSGFKYAFLLSSPGTKETLATALTAQASGKSLQVVGKGTCTVDASLEDVNYVVLQP